MMKNDRGMTLVEVLAALTILGIVFVGFMTIFPQMTLFNEKTNDKLVTMNLAKQELKSLESLKDLERKLVGSEKEPLIVGNIKRYEYKLKNEDDEETGFVCSVDYYTEKSLNGEVHGDTLHRITIKILKSDKVLSETFGYINE